MINELGDNLIPLTAMVLAFAFFVTWIVAATIDSVYKTNCNTRLKERLIAKGSSVDEIERILKAGKPAHGMAASQAMSPMPPRKHCA